MTDTDEVGRAARVLAAAGDQLRADLTEAGEARKAAQAALDEATTKLHDLIYDALQTKLIPVSTIHKFAGVAPSRVYQIQAEKRAKAQQAEQQS